MKMPEEAGKMANVLLDALSEYVLFVDPQMQIRWANRAAIESAGMSLEEISGRRCYEIWHERKSICPDCPISRVLETGRPHEGENTSPENRRWSIRGYPIHDEQGQLLGAAEIAVDITALRRAQEALEESEAKYTTLVEQANEAVVIVQDGVIKFLNKAAIGAFGYSQEELLGKPFQSLLAPESQEDVATKYSQRMAGDTPPNFYQAQAVHKDGRKLSFEVSVATIQYEGKPAVLGIARDNTKRQRAEQALRESEAKYAALVENAQDAIVIMQDGFCKYINQAAQDIYGYTLEELQQRPFIELVAPESRKTVVKRYQAYFSGEEKAPLLHRAQIIHKNGTRREVESTGAIIEYQGSPAILGIFRDVTARARAEEALKESEAKYAALVENAKDVIVIIQDGIVQFANRAVEMTGYTVEEMVGKPFTDFLAPESREDAAERIALRLNGEGISTTFELKMLHKNGTQLDAEASSTAIEFRGKPAILGFASNITERKQAEKALRESEERFRALSTGAFDGVVIHEKGIILETNEAFNRIFLTEPGEAIGKSVLDYAAPESRDSIKKKMLSGHDQPYEATGLRKDGTRMYGELMGRNIIYKGRQARVVAVRDLSDRKKAEDALRESEERYRSVIETCPDAITLSSLDGSLITANLQSARLYGCDSVEELLSSVHSAFDIISSEDQHRAAENAKKTLKEGTVRNVEYRMVRKDGSTHPAELSASTILDAEGKPKAFVGVVRDISERKQVEQALRESEERYRTLVETSPDAIVMTDTTNKLVMVNQGTAQLLGYDSAEEVMEKVDNVFAHIDQEFHETAQRKFENYGETRGTRASVYRLVRRDKSKVYVEVNSSVIPDADGNMAWVISVIRDITDRIEAEEERRKLEEQIQHAQKLESLGILAGGIAHDFNNLLMGVLGNASLALLDLPEGLPVRHCVEQIEKTARAAADLTNQMLAYSGKGRFVVEPLDLSRVVKDMAGLLKVSISKKVDLKFDFDRDLPPVEADAAQLRQVIMNLIINASEAIGDEPGVVSVRTGTVKADSSFFAETYTHDNLPEGTYVYLEVADSGCGMDPGTISRIFDPFFTSKFTGRGLGLAAVLGIVRGHQGAVRVQSEPGQGSTIRVVFPPAKAGKHPPAPEPQRKKPGKVGGKILVVDDEATIRDVARRMLESSGFEVITAADGRDAVEIFKDQGDAIAGVLLDATMPQMDGLETFEELRRVRKDVRVVLSSGYSEQEATQRFTGKGLTGFIQKPYRFDELIDKMNEVLGE